MIVPGAQPEFGVDCAIADIFPDGTLLCIASADDVEGLTKAILHLHHHPSERRARGRATFEVAKQAIPSWRERIDTETRLLESLATSKRPGRTVPRPFKGLEGRL